MLTNNTRNKKKARGLLMLSLDNDAIALALALPSTQRTSRYNSSVVALNAMMQVSAISSNPFLNIMAADERTKNMQNDKARKDVTLVISSKEKIIKSHKNIVMNILITRS
jgi:hypothetical protein